MAEYTITDMKAELVVYLRNSNIISVATRGVTTQTDTGTYAGATSDTLNTNPTLVKNVRSIIVGGTTLSAKSDYTVNYATGVITYTSAQTGDYTISYDTGTTDRIFQDYPQAHLKRSDFPRIAVDIQDGATRDFELGAATTVTDYIGYVICYDTAQSNVDTMVAVVRSVFIPSVQSFKNMPLVGIGGTGPRLQSDFGELRCFQRNVTLRIPAIHES